MLMPSYSGSFYFPKWDTERREGSLLIVLLWYLVGKKSLCIKSIVSFRYLTILFISSTPTFNLPPQAPKTPEGGCTKERTGALSVVHVIGS